MSAIPSNLYTSPKVSGLKSIKTTSISLRPVNASTNTQFGPNSNNVVSFHIPAYPNSFISPKSTFLSFIAKAIPTVGGQKFRMNAGYPCVERLQIKSGNGMVIVDCDDYHILQKLMQNFDDEYDGQGTLIGDYRAHEGKAAAETRKDTDDVDFNGDGVTIQHNILAGLFSESDAYIPVGLFSAAGGHALEINFYLAKSYMCMSGVTASDVGGFSYNLSNTTLQLELVQLPESVNQKLNDQIMRGDKVSIPMANWRSHKSYVPPGSKSVDITITESAHDLESVMSVLLPNATVSTTNTQKYGNEENTGFLGGKTDAGKSLQRVVEYQFGHADRYFPSQKVELKTKDQRLALMHAIKNLDLTGKKPYVVDKVDAWKEQFCIVQSFKTSKEDDFLNGMNTSAVAAPLILQLSLEAPLTGNSYRVVTFVKQNQTLNIFKGGYTSLTDGMVSSE
jgi:hypothetical protein